MYKQLGQLISKSKHVYVLSGAGLSAPSNVPTFQGTEHMWARLHAQGKNPMLVLRKMVLDFNPKSVWNWFIDYKQKIAQAQPNPAHLALLKLQEHYKIKNKEFSHTTLNIDGLQASLMRKSKILTPNGIAPEGTKEFGYTEGLMEIQGNGNFMRCNEECRPFMYSIPNNLKENDVPPCPRCGMAMRPHMLLFDECYFEGYYKSTTAVDKGLACDCLIAIGTELQTQLPNSLVYEHIDQGKLFVEINLKEVVKSDKKNVHRLIDSCDKTLPALVDAIISAD